MNKAKTSLIERGVGKHPLLRPELIVINDQLTGFKKIKKKLEALEELPVFYDIECYWDEEEAGWYIDYIDLYIEAEVSIQDHLSDAIYLSKLFQDVLVLDRVFNTSYESEESIRITSLINEALAVDLVDMEEEEMMLQVNFTSVPVIKPYVTGLLDFMYVLHGLIQENKSLKSLEAWLKNKNEK
jgi:hypothetical protein